KRNQRRPFFLYLPFTLPHADLAAPAEVLARYANAFLEQPYPGDPEHHRPPIPAPRATMAAMISRLDQTVREALRLTESLDLQRKTVVVFTSDNGPATIEIGADSEFFHASGPLRGAKRSLYEGGIRVPMIARWPGVIQSGKVSDRVWSFWD